MSPDFVNGLFEFFGGLLVLNHCRVILKDKAVKGVSILSTAVFGAWGVWNLYYYPSLNQWWSFTGGLVIVAANCTYVYLLRKYAEPGVLPRWVAA